MKWDSVFSYDKQSGRLLWRGGKKGRGCVEGKEAGTNAHHGYRAVMVDGKKHYVHRIVWEMNNGEISSSLCIDHIDGDRSNNRLENLRLLSLSLNQRNTVIPKNNPLGIIGVYRKAKGFVVQCANQYVGFYGDFFQACCARKSAELRLEFHENHGRKFS